MAVIIERGKTSFEQLSANFNQAVKGGLVKNDEKKVINFTSFKK